jgi:hypothetical protein
MLCAMEWGVFLFFAGFVLLMTLFITFLVPETNGVPVEEVDRYIVGKHWLWSRVVAGAVEESETIEDGVPEAVKLSKAVLERAGSASDALGAALSASHLGPSIRNE